MTRTKNSAGSGMAPDEDGNTKSSSSARTPRDNAKKLWFITLHAPTWNIGSSGSNVKKWITEHCVEAVWQVESGDKTGAIHLQMTLNLRTKNRLSWLKNHFHQTAHCEIVRNHDKAYDYCQKSETRIAGPFYYPERISETIRDPLENCEYYHWQREIIDIITGPIDDRKIYWYWDPIGNIGKTTFAKHIYLKYGCRYLNGAKKDVLHVWCKDPQKTAVFNFSRKMEGKVSYDAVEIIKDGIGMTPKFDSQDMVWDPPHIICFANWLPDTSALSQDRWDIRLIKKDS